MLFKVYYHLETKDIYSLIIEWDEKVYKHNTHASPTQDNYLLDFYNDLYKNNYDTFYQEIENNFTDITPIKFTFLNGTAFYVEYQFSNEKEYIDKIINEIIRKLKLDRQAFISSLCIDLINKHNNNHLFETADLKHESSTLIMCVIMDYIQREITHDFNIHTLYKNDITEWAGDIKQMRINIPRQLTTDMQAKNKELADKYLSLSFIKTTGA